MHYGKKHDLPFGIMDVAGLLRLNIRRRAPGQVYVDCPICGDRRGKMNLNTGKDLWRCNYCGEGGGMLSLYAKVYGVSNSDAYREICDALAVNGFSPDYTVPEKTTPAEAEQSDAASVQEVHQTLSMLLSMLTLIQAHREHLRSVRGLSDDEITRFGFKSTPPPFLCRSLTNRLVKAGCRVQGVPGFYVDDNGCWTVKFHQRTSGIIIPIFGVDGLIHGAQIRLDHPLKDKDDPPEKTGVKYLTLSSTGKRMGTTSGSPIHFVGDPCSRVVYVTEGCLKADVAHALIHCFQYISRKAWDYVQDELKANGVQPGPGQQAYGCDIPDDLCYQWAEDYFRDPDAKEDQGDEEEFVPQPYRGKTSSKSVSKKKKEEKKKEPEKEEPPKKAEADDGQISLGDLSSFGEAA